MKMQRPVLTLLCASLLVAFGGQALAATDTQPAATNTEATKLATRYSDFAGSDANALALVDGLRNGESVTLDTTSTVKNADGTTSTVITPTTFQPATHKMGYGNVNIALALAQDELTKAGVTDPTAAEIEAALNGGSITSASGETQTFQGVLALRAQGEGWGKVSKTLGVKLGDVVSASHNDHSHAGTDHEHHDHGLAAANRPVHPDHPVHPDRPQHPDVPHRQDIPDHAGGPGH